MVTFIILATLFALWLVFVWRSRRWLKRLRDAEAERLKLARKDPEAADQESQKWESHPEYKKIKYCVNQIVRILDMAEFKSSKEAIAQMMACITSYQYLLNVGFAKSSGWIFERLPRGLRKDATTLIPEYAFPDFFLNRMMLVLKNGFNSQNPGALRWSFDPDAERRLRSLLEQIRASMAGVYGFEKAGFATKTTDELMIQIKYEIFGDQK